MKTLTVCADAALQVGNLGQRGVLSAGAQQVAQRSAVNAAVAALVEELEGFAVVGRGLVAVIHCCSLCVDASVAGERSENRRGRVGRIGVTRGDCLCRPVAVGEAQMLPLADRACQSSGAEQERRGPCDSAQRRAHSPLCVLRWYMCMPRRNLKGYGCGGQSERETGGRDGRGFGV